MIYISKMPFVTTIDSVVHDVKLELFGSGLLQDVRDTGEDIMITCPFHNGGRERNPSFGISKHERVRDGKSYEAGTCHCYSCGYKSDLPKFISDVLGLDTKLHGLAWMKERYLYAAGKERGDIDLDFSRDEPEDDRMLFSGVLVSHYHEALLRSDRAKDYLKGRNLLHLPTLDKFGVGYDSEKDMIVFPVYDRQGQVRMLKKRSIEGKRFDNTAGAGKASLIFGLYQVMVFGKKDEPVWVCESETDALTVWAYGGQAIALMGSHISGQQVEEVSRTWVRMIVDGLDRDDAGRKGLRAMKDILIPRGFRIWNTKGWGSRKDLNELTSTEFTNLELF